jgi:hypothetical protein
MEGSEIGILDPSTGISDLLISFLISPICIVVIVVMNRQELPSDVFLCHTQRAQILDCYRNISNEPMHIKLWYRSTVRVSGCHRQPDFADHGHGYETCKEAAET